MFASSWYIFLTYIYDDGHTYIKYISTVCMEMKFIGIAFGNRCMYLQSLVCWGFISSFMLLYHLVRETELYLEQTSGGQENYCINTGFYFY